MRLVKYKFPSVRRWILGRMLRNSIREAALKDFEERFDFVSGNRGRFVSFFWYWFQIIVLLPSFIGDMFYWRIAMLKNYLFIALRNLKKNRIYSSLNIIGLAVGLAAFILIALYVQYELSFDKYHENSDRIYRVVREDSTFTPAPLGPALTENFPEVVAVTRIIQSKNMLISHEQDHFLEDEFYWAGPATFEIFTIPFIKGDPQTALDDPSAILISARIAAKYFGNEDPLGKVLTVNNRTNFTVSGIFSGMPANSHFVMDIIVPYVTYFQITNNDITRWRSNFSYTYFLLQEGTNPEGFENKIHPTIERPLFEQAGFKEPYPKMYSIQPITEIHLHSHRMQEIGVNNDIIYILLFSAIAFLILFIACVNYMNLATARSIRRASEVGMRKVVGAQRKQLIVQFLSESVAMTFLAMFLSLIIIVLALPAFNSLVERQLSINPVANPQFFLGLVFIVFIVGLFAGSYPAMRVSGFRPISVLSGAFTKSSKGLALRNILVLVQFSITIILIICTLTVREQLDFVKNMDVGYSKEQIITLGVRDRAVRQNIQAIKTELLRYSDVVAVSTSGRLPNDIDTFTSRDWTGRNPDEPIPIFYNTTDYDFIDLFDIQIVEGRNFSRDFPSDEKSVFLVNEAAVRVAEWESPIGRKLTHWRGDTGKIVGIMKDFHHHSLHRPIDPLYIFLDASDYSTVSIKIKSIHIPATIDYVESVMKKFSPNLPFDYSFFDDVFERAYNTEQRMVSIFSSFAILAILIACLGLFGLAAFAAEQRTKEIGIRKVVGASVPKIILLLSKEFIRWVVLANIIAWPVAYFAMNRWLQNFAYRIDLSVLLFLFAAVVALIISGLTVSVQSVKAAAANPVEALKYE